MNGKRRRMDVYEDADDENCYNDEDKWSHCMMLERWCEDEEGSDCDDATKMTMMTAMIMMRKAMLMMITKTVTIGRTGGWAGGSDDDDDVNVMATMVTRMTKKMNIRNTGENQNEKIRKV